MGEPGKLNIDPAVLAGACEALSGAAEQLLRELKSLDGTVTGMLANWQGSAGGAYGDVWRQWHTGADEVEVALAAMAKLLGEAGKAYAAGEQRSAGDLGSLANG
ncbi:MAG: WXG100 family type VII secretion target [Mycobacterium sp.]|nr:WXG100 family type VII secretion target [Mycobacterium sp.]